MRKKYEKVDLKCISKETNKIRGKNQILNKGAQAHTNYIIKYILSKLYYTKLIIKVQYTSYIKEVKLFKLYYTLYYRSYTIGVVLQDLY